MGKLTDRGIRNKRKAGRYGDGGGLYLAVSAKAKSWLFIGQLDGKRYVRGLGPYPARSLEDARVDAAKLRRDLKNGTPPISKRSEWKTAKANTGTAKTSKTFGQVADAYFQAHNGSWKSAKHRWQWERSLNDECADLRPLPVKDITVDHVLKILSPTWPSVTARRLRGRIESVLDYAKAMEYRPRESQNPALWKGNLLHLLAKPKRNGVEHLAAMDYRAVPKFMAELRNDNSTIVLCLQFIILTAVRNSEARLAKWSEINFEDRVWIIPSGRMKASQEHRVPLSDAAIAILQEMQNRKASEFVFPGKDDGKPLGEHTVIKMLRRMDKEITIHGFRSSFRDWAADVARAPREIAEAALSHQVGSAVERSYRRGDALDQRRQLMDAWASYCEPKEGNVIPIGRSPPTIPAFPPRAG